MFKKKHFLNLLTKEDVDSLSPSKSLKTYFNDNLYKINNLENKSKHALNNYQKEQLKVYQNALEKPIKHIGILINTMV